MEIEIETKQHVSLKEETKRYIEDIKRCAKDKKMYINEKSFLLRCIEKLYDVDYYSNNESFYKEYMHE